MRELKFNIKVIILKMLIKSNPFFDTIYGARLSEWAIQCIDICNYLSSNY